MLNKSKGNMFGWINATWNTISGRCHHNCEYCLCRGTKILMNDFSEKNIEDIKIGDKVIGLKNMGKPFKRFQEVLVLDTFKRISKTINIITNKGNLRCTPEHKIMGSTEKRSWTDWKQAKEYSPYQVIRKIGNFTGIDQDWKFGWLSGYIEGDGCFFNHHGNYLGFEAVSNKEDLRIFLKKIALEFGIELRDGIKRTTKKSFSKGKDYNLVFTRKDEQARKLKEISSFRINQPLSFYKGYLAGIIDAEGTIIDYIRIAQSKKVNLKVFEHITFSLNKLDFKFVEEKSTIRIIGGLNMRLKILFECNPQSLHKKKRLIFGNSIKGSGYDIIESITQNGEQEVYNIKTESENYIANGFIVHNCYNIGKPYFEGELRFMEKNLKDNLGENNLIFVGSSNDLFQDDIPNEWILKTLEHCRKFNNTYVFQTKNPKRFNDFINEFPISSIFGTTLESNRDYKNSLAKDVYARAFWLSHIRVNTKFITCEPILDFDLKEFVGIIKGIQPQFVNIGADSKGHNLQEPSKEKIEALIKELKKFTEVKIKDNLKRLL